MYAQLWNSKVFNICQTTATSVMHVISAVFNLTVHGKCLINTNIQQVIFSHVPRDPHQPYDPLVWVQTHIWEPLGYAQNTDKKKVYSERTILLAQIRFLSYTTFHIVSSSCGLSLWITIRFRKKQGSLFIGLTLRFIMPKVLNPG